MFKLKMAFKLVELLSKKDEHMTYGTFLLIA